LNNFNNNSNFNANDRNINNNNRVRGIAQRAETFIFMNDLWQQICSSQNLELAFKRARKHKTLKLYVVEFESDLQNNLSLLRTELLLHSYQPRPLETFILRDPKTRKISKSHFRDRIVHHALCNIIEPIFEKSFLCDSYANRIGKGALKAISRFEYFSRKVTKNNKIQN
jgi:retron-type reverse transcriptase